MEKNGVEIANIPKSYSLNMFKDFVPMCVFSESDQAVPPTLSEILRSNLRSDSETKQDEIKKVESNEQEEDKEKNKGLKRKSDSTDSSDDQENDSHKENEQNPKDKKLKRAKNIAISMATKAATLARKFKSIMSDLCFMQERCTLQVEQTPRTSIIGISTSLHDLYFRKSGSHFCHV